MREKEKPRIIMVYAEKRLFPSKVLLVPLFFQGAEPSAACGRCSEAQHGQNNEKSNVVQISIMFCTWSKAARLSINTSPT
ncbi:MAG: hypothetical protein IJI97_05015 [Clostridia bacterium]|nr:hypothetical protein [Clostridia bacterium]MBQ6358303.1 hypothetical protein [Clostridia bacterium]MBR0206839.1 hypothetical protein [Clostridia bacterium]